jgi:hypothetical protein
LLNAFGVFRKKGGRGKNFLMMERKGEGLTVKMKIRPRRHMWIFAGKEKTKRRDWILKKKISEIHGDLHTAFLKKLIC